MKLKLLILFIAMAAAANAQTLGGNAAYNFLKLPSSPLLSAAGGANVSYNAREAGFAANNPALLGSDMHGQLAVSFNSFIGGIKTYSTTGVLHKASLNTTFSGHVYFVDYGSIPLTDAAGNVMGNFHPVDFVIQAGASRKYLERWSYGANLKFIHSQYEQYGSSALALDLGLIYEDSANGFDAGFLAKNMGVQLSSYNGDREDLPFDMQIGITKRLSKSPFGFSLTAQQLHRFDILYNDTFYNQANELEANKGFINKLINHFILAAHLYVGPSLEATVGYNFLRRSELNMGNTGNGLNGFSLGLRLKFQKLQIQYARAYYSGNIAYNQLGITMKLNKMFGITN